MTGGSRGNRNITLLASQQYSPEETEDGFQRLPLDAKIIPLDSISVQGWTSTEDI